MTTTPTVPPTFDEWFAAKSEGMTFDDLHMFHGAQISDAIRALTVEIREYATHVARAGHPPTITPPHDYTAEEEEEWQRLERKL